MLKVTPITWLGFERSNHQGSLWSFHLFLQQRSVMHLAPEQFLACVARSILPRSHLWPTADDWDAVVKLQLTACWFSLVISKQDWITCCIKMAIWRKRGKELFGVASSPMLMPSEETTPTLYIISFFQECYLVSQRRLLVTVFPSNLINNSFFCCLGSLVRQTKLQCCQACWWPTVTLAEHSALF